MNELLRLEDELESQFPTEIRALRKFYFEIMRGEKRIIK